MAVARGPGVITMSADADAVTGRLAVQALAATGAVAGVVNTADEPVWAAAAEAHVTFPRTLYVDGIKRGAGAGMLYVYLA